MSRRAAKDARDAGILHGAEPRERYFLHNLGAMGTFGESLFSTHGRALASRLIEEGWVPCGMFVNKHDEVLQAFYLPMESDDEYTSQN